MTRDDARAALRRAFVATGDVPEEWADLLVQVTEAALAEPPPPKRRRWRRT